MFRFVTKFFAPSERVDAPLFRQPFLAFDFHVWFSRDYATISRAASVFCDAQNILMPLPITILTFSTDYCLFLVLHILWQLIIPKSDANKFSQLILRFQPEPDRTFDVQDKTEALLVVVSVSCCWSVEAEVSHFALKFINQGTMYIAVLFFVFFR